MRQTVDEDMITVSVLSEKDVQLLLTDPSPATRVTTVRKIGKVLGLGKISDKERKLALDVFSVMAHDAEVLVRRELAESIKNNPNIPRDLVQRLARDVAEVASPVLQMSSLLTDEDLLEIIALDSRDHQVAIAGRPGVSETVSGALIERGDETVVTTLLKNDSAQIADAALHTALSRFPGAGSVPDAMAQRSRLPLIVAERLVAQVSETLRLHLVAHHDLSPDLATDLVLDSRERAFVHMIADNGQVRDLVALVDELKQNGRLTSTLLLRALYIGDLDFFVQGLASIAKISVANAQHLIYDPGPLGLKALYQRCGLPDRMLPMARVAMSVASEMQYDGGPADRARFVERAIERLLTHFDGPVPEDDIDWLVGRLSRARAEAMQTARGVRV